MHFLKKESLIFQNSGIKSWIIAIRPKTLFASFCPVTVGGAIAYADGRFHLPSFLFALISAVFIQIGTNLANDYYDFIHKIDTSERIGPVRVVQAGLISADKVKKAFIFCFLLSSISGLYLILRAGIPILIIGILSITFGILYSALPSFCFLSDLAVAIFFGPVAVSGTYYVQALSIERKAVIAGIPPGLISTAILVVNNLRDMESDKKAGKRTLTVIFGKRFGKAEYFFLILSSFFFPFLLKERRYHLMCEACILFFIPSLLRIYRKDPGPEYNKILQDTSFLLFAYSMLFSLGWIIG